MTKSLFLPIVGIAAFLLIASGCAKQNQPDSGVPLKNPAVGQKAPSPGSNKNGQALPAPTVGAPSSAN